MTDLSTHPHDRSDISRRKTLQMLFGSLLIIILMLILLLTGVGSVSYKSVLYLLMGVSGIIVAGAIFLRPEFGAYLLVLTIFTNFSNTLELNGFPSVNKPLVVLVAVSLIIRLVIRRSGIIALGAPEILLFGFGAVAALTFLVAQDQEKVLSWSIDYAKDLIILTCIIYALRSPDVWKRAGWILILSASVLALMGLYQVVTGNYHHDFFGLATVHYDSSIVNNETAVRLQGPLDDPNFFGQIMVSTLPLAIYRIFNSSKFSFRMLGFLASTLIGFAVIFSYSRGAFLAMMVIFLVILIERRVDQRVLISLLAAGILMFLFLPSSYIARIRTLSSFTNPDSSSYIRDNSLRGRSSEMQAGILMWEDYPILGVGIDNYPENYKEYSQQIGLEYRSEMRQAHSIYIQYLAETGIVGISIFIAFLITLFLNLRRAYRKLKLWNIQESFVGWTAGIGISIVGYLVSSIFLHGDYFRYFILLVALCLAMIHIVNDPRSLQGSIPVSSEAESL